MFAPLIGLPEGAEWFVILAIVILVFGAAKLPDLARGTGQALRIFKAETKGLTDNDDKTPKPPPAAPSVIPPTQATQVPLDETTPEQRPDATNG